MFKLETKLQALRQIYGICGRFVEDLKIACEHALFADHRTYRCRRFGNLVDILRSMAGETHRTDYACGSLSVSGLRLIRNRPMKKLFVPPEHRMRIQPILRSLQAIRA